MPRAFRARTSERNLALVERLRDVADGERRDVAQVAIAWVLSRGEDIVPLIGARTRERLTEALGALDCALSQAICVRSSRPCPRTPPLAIAIARRRWPSSTASAELACGRQR